MINRNSIEAAENAPAEEKYDWYGSPANIERILQREFNNEMHCDTSSSKKTIPKETKYK